MLKHNGAQTMRNSPPETTDSLQSLPSDNQHFCANSSRPLSASKPQLLHETRPAGGGSPKSVIRDQAPSTHSTYHSCSSSSSAERAALVKSQQQQLGTRPLLPVDQHYNAANDKPKWKTVKRKEDFVLIEGSTLPGVLDESSTDHSDCQMRERDQNGFYLHTLDSDFEFDPPSKVVTQPSVQPPQPLIATTAQISKPSKCHEAFVPRGVSSSSKGEDTNASKQGAPMDSLMNAFMKQYHPPSFVTAEDVKPFKHPCLNEVFANVCNDGFNSDSMRPKFIASKWDSEEKWACTKLSSTSASTLTTSNHKVPAFKLSHNDHTIPVLSAAQEGFSLPTPGNKAHEIQQGPFHPNPSLWDKDTLKNEVDKLSNAVSCAQACLERIQPTPPSRSAASTGTNPFLAQGVFQKQTYPMLAQCMLKPNSQLEPVIARAALRSSHAPTPGANSTEQLFWGSPVRQRTSHTAENHSPGLQAVKKESARPLSAQIGTARPPNRDGEDSPNQKEQFCVQKHEIIEGQTLTSTSYMKDASTEITPTASHRDIGTQITPAGSSRHPSPRRSPQQGRAMSPIRQTAPMRPPVPIFQSVIDMRRISPADLEPLPCHRARHELLGLSGSGQVQPSLGTSFNSNWSSREEEEEEIGKGLRHLDLEDLKRDVLDARATAWKEENKLKLLARYEREQTKIQAWEDMQAAKAQTELKKLEAQLEKKRVQTRAKIANRLGAAHKKADGRRAAAKANKKEAMEKTCHRADEMRETTHLFKAKHPLCGCFSQPLM